jgi:type IV secretion system protein VirB10
MMPSRPDPQISPAEAAVRLRAHPPSPKRLSRKVLLAGAGSVGVVIAFALVTGLSPRSEAASPRKETAPPATPALPEGLSSLPAKYEAGALTQAGLPPEEPYDRLWGPDGPPEHLALYSEDYEDALSLPEDSAWDTPEPQEEIYAPEPVTAEAPYQPELFFARREPATTFSINTQPTRGAGATASQAASQTYLTATPGPPPGPPYLIQSGSTIPAALLTAVNSDLPGRVIAQVSAPVYDSQTGDYLLIPQGARLIGTYESENSYGDTRVFLSWDRLLMPDGASLDLKRMAATDAAGSSGLAAKVDNHLGRVGGAIAVSAVLSILANEAENKDDQGFTRSLGDAAAQEAARTGSRIVDRELNLRPTLRVPAGAPVRVLVTNDILLEPYTE